MQIVKYLRDFQSSDLLGCGNKFSNLVKLYSIVDVPPALCLTSNALHDSLPQDVYDKIESLLLLLKTNGGYQLTRIHKEIVFESSKIELTAVIKQELKEAFTLLNPERRQPLIVRSSSSYEDSTAVSGAGIYESQSNVQTEEELTAAVLYCWASFFSLSALAHRLRIGEYGIGNLPALIIQKYMPCVVSGVTFSKDPIGNSGGIYTEYSDKGSDAIESGKSSARGFKAFLSGRETIISENDLTPALVQDIIECSKSIGEVYPIPMEFEWLSTGENFYVVQTRPITTINPELSGKGSSNVPVLEIHKAYDEFENLISSDLGDVSEVYAKSINKRKPIRDIATHNNVSVHGVTVIRANRRGINTLAIGESAELNRVGTPLLTVDLGPHIRSFFVRRGNINKVLAMLLEYSKDIGTFIVREFAAGEFSAISTKLSNDIYVVEICRGSLIGINRGFVDTNTYEVDMRDNSVKAINPRPYPKRYYGFDEENQCFAFKTAQSTLPHDCIPKSVFYEICRFTKIANEQKLISLEWTIMNGRPVFIDHTNLSNAVLMSALSSDNDDLYPLSPGKIDGEVIVVDDLEKFEYISAGPTLNISGNAPAMSDNPEVVRLLEMAEKNTNLVIVSKYPYTAFSVLVDKVKGFIFESGPVLCHLSIICREQHTPAFVVPNALTKYKDGDQVKL